MLLGTVSGIECQGLNGYGVSAGSCGPERAHQLTATTGPADGEGEPAREREIEPKTELRVSGNRRR